MPAPVAAPLAGPLIMAGGTLIGGLINAWSANRAVKFQLEAQAMADRTNIDLYERAQRAEDVRFGKELKLSKAQLAEQKKLNKYTMVNNTVTNILQQLNSRGNVRDKFIAMSRGRR